MIFAGQWILQGCLIPPFDGLAAETILSAEVRPSSDLSLSLGDRGVVLLQPWKAENDGVLWRLEHEQTDVFVVENSDTQLDILRGELNATGAQGSAI